MRVLIVDDEPLARRRLRLLLERTPDVTIVGECAEGNEAVSAILSSAIDVVFLDVQMPDLDGFGVVEAVGPDAMPCVVFVTAFDRYALDAFEVCAIDYLLKPFEDSRFQQALERARERVHHRAVDDVNAQLYALMQRHGRLASAPNAARAEPLVADRKYDRRLAVQVGRHVRLVTAAEIDWIGAEGSYVRLHAGKASHLMRGSMRELEERLDPDLFVRVHRSTIVNVDRIHELHPMFHGEQAIILIDGTRLKLSRTYRDHLERLMGSRAASSRRG